MLAQELVLIIFFIIFVQVAIYAAIAFYRHWLVYEELKKRLSALEIRPIDLPQPEHPAPQVLWKGFRDFRVQRRVFEDANQTVCSFYLVPVDKEPLPSFYPGQYLTFQFHLPSSVPPQKVVRCYSLSDAPNSDYYRITVKKVPSPQPHIPAGLCSHYLHEQVHEETILSVRAPAGHFYLTEFLKGPIVLIAGGIGITPLLSMVQSCLHHTPQREVWFYYGVRNGREHLMKELLVELAKKHPQLHLHICYSQPEEGDREGIDYHHKGHVNLTLLRLTLFLKLYHFYVCGPKAMMESLVPDLRAWGIPEENIHYEAFGPASLAKPALPKASNTAVTVTFSQSNQSFPWSNSATSLLEFAEDHGITIPSGCRAGHCGTCQTRLEEGEVEYRQSPDSDLPPGTCLLCITVPKTNITLSA